MAPRTHPHALRHDLTPPNLAVSDASSNGRPTIRSAGPGPPTARMSADGASAPFLTKPSHSRWQPVMSPAQSHPARFGSVRGRIAGDVGKIPDSGHRWCEPPKRTPPPGGDAIGRATVLGSVGGTNCRGIKGSPIWWLKRLGATRCEPAILCPRMQMIAVPGSVLIWQNWLRSGSVKVAATG
jgi:hypothetical protein